MRKPSMGRKKIEIKKIEKLESLQVCFSKRRVGLFKKASELCILCDAEIAIIAFSPAGKVFSFGHPCVDTNINHYLMSTSSTADPIMEVVISSDGPRRAAVVKELNRRYMELVNHMEADKKRELSGCSWVGPSLPPTEETRLQELEKYRELMVNLRNKVVERLHDLWVNGVGTSSLLPRPVPRFLKFE